VNRVFYLGRETRFTKLCRFGKRACKVVTLQITAGNMSHFIGWADQNHRLRKLFNGIFPNILEQNWDSNS
jgi:hypothetical protein